MRQMAMMTALMAWGTVCWAMFGEHDIGEQGLAQRRGVSRMATSMKLPRHISLTIEHNPHATYYKTVADWLEEADTFGHLEIDPADRAAMLSTGEVWYINWHPDTPVGSCCVAAATLERALELASDDDPEIAVSLLDRDPTPEDLDAERDEPRPGVWAGEPGADLRALTQDETDCLIRHELCVAADLAELDDIPEVIADLNVATNDVAVTLTALHGRLSAGVPATQTDLAQLQALAARLHSLAADPTNPVPA